MDVTQAPINLDAAGKFVPFDSLPVLLAGYEPSDNGVTQIDVQWRALGAPLWIVETFPTSGNAPFLMGQFITGLAAGFYEWQVRGHKGATVGAWSASQTFQVLATPPAAYPLVDVGDQWGDPAGYTLTGDDLTARIVDKVNALASLIVNWAANADDLLRASSAGVLLHFTSDTHQPANTPLAWPSVTSRAHGYPMWAGSAMGGADDAVHVLVPGRYLITLTVGSTDNTDAVDVSLLGLPPSYGQPTATITASGHPASLEGCFDLNGTEQLVVELAEACTVDASATRFGVWRIGL